MIHVYILLFPAYPAFVHELCYTWALQKVMLTYLYVHNILNTYLIHIYSLLLTAYPAFVHELCYTRALQTLMLIHMYVIHMCM